MKLLFPCVILTCLLAGSFVEAADFIPEHRLPQHLGKEITIEGVTRSRDGYVFAWIDVLDEDGYYAYELFVFQSFPTEMQTMCKKAWESDQLVKCKIRGKLAWSASDEIFEGLDVDKLSPPPPGISSEFFDSLHNHYQLVDPVFSSFEIMDDNEKLHIGKEFWAEKVIPFVGGEEEPDGFEIRNKGGELIAACHLADYRKKWHQLILDYCITPPVEERKTIRIVGMITGWERRDGVEHYIISEWNALPEVPLEDEPEVPPEEE